MIGAEMKRYVMHVIAHSATLTPSRRPVGRHGFGDRAACFTAPRLQGWFPRQFWSLVYAWPIGMQPGAVRLLPGGAWLSNHHQGW
jgi:hypothetical protein